MPEIYIVFYNRNNKLRTKSKYEAFNGLIQDRNFGKTYYYKNK